MYSKDDVWTANLFLDHKDQYTFNIITSTSENFCRFTWMLSNFKMNNASGSSYGAHCGATIKDGVLLISYNNINNCCNIKIASIPTSSWELGDQNPGCYGNPHPKLFEGEWVNVYDGRIKKDGPWWSKIEEVINYFVEQMNGRSIKIIEWHKINQKELSEKRLVKEKELVANWS